MNTRLFWNAGTSRIYQQAFLVNNTFQITKFTSPPSEHTSLLTYTGTFRIWKNTRLFRMNICLFWLNLCLFWLKLCMYVFWLNLCLFRLNLCLFWLNTRFFGHMQKHPGSAEWAAIPSDSGACAIHQSTVHSPCATQKNTIYFKRALCIFHVRPSPPTQVRVQPIRALYISHVQLKRAPYISKEHYVLPMCRRLLRLIPMCNSKEHCIFPMCNSKEHHTFQKSTIHFKRALCTSHVQTPPPTQGRVQLKRALCTSHLQKSTIHFPCALKRLEYILKEHCILPMVPMCKRSLYIWNEHCVIPMCNSKEYHVFQKNTLQFPCAIQKNPASNSKETCIHSKETYIHSKETYILIFAQPIFPPERRIFDSGACAVQLIRALYISHVQSKQALQITQKRPMFDSGHFQRSSRLVV